MDNLEALPKKLDDQKARDEWGWSIRYGLKEMVEDFVKESNRGLL
jgi:nucleoside-diphosphate-sugar epimerase